MSTLTVAIGNSDDKLSQAVWAQYWGAVNEVVRAHTGRVFGVFLSVPSAPYQNACWLIEGQLDDQFRAALAQLARIYGQDCIAVSVGETVLVRSSGPDTGE